MFETEWSVDSAVPEALSPSRRLFSVYRNVKVSNILLSWKWHRLDKVLNTVQGGQWGGWLLALLDVHIDAQRVQINGYH